MRKLVAHLPTMARYVRNANPSRLNDLCNGRSSIPIAQSSSYRGHILPEGRNEVCGSGRPLKGPPVFDDLFAVKGRQSILSQVYGITEWAEW